MPEAALDPLLDKIRLLSGAAVHDDVVGIPFEVNAWKIVQHPLIEGQMQKIV